MQNSIAPQGKRWCCRCQKHLPADQFHKGNTGYCKTCRSAYLRETYNPELVRERNARYYKKRKEKIMSVHQHTIVALAPGKFHCVTCEKNLTALDLLVVVNEPTEVHVVLRGSAEEDCLAFEAELASIAYVSDGAEDNGSVTYTLYGVSEETVKQRIEQAKVVAEILDW